MRERDAAGLESKFLLPRALDFFFLFFCARAYLRLTRSITTTSCISLQLTTDERRLSHFLSLRIESSLFNDQTTFSLSLSLYVLHSYVYMHESRTHACMQSFFFLLILPRPSMDSPSEDTSYSTYTSSSIAIDLSLSTYVSKRCIQFQNIYCILKR
jgi:hypothetical protein